MNGIDKITGQIDAGAQEEINSLLDSARREAGEIAARYEAQARREAETLLERGRREAAEQEERLVSAARLEAKKQVLAVKQELVAQAFDAALDQLCKLPDTEYVALLARLAAGASSTGHEKVIFSPKDRTRFGKQIVTQANGILSKTIPGAMLTLCEETRPIRGGFLLAGDRMEVNCSFEALVRAEKESMTAEAARMLFADAD